MDSYSFLDVAVRVMKTTLDTCSLLCPNLHHTVITVLMKEKGRQMIDQENAEWN